MARLRTSSHSLAIEVGRFHKPRPLLETDRLCTVCDIIEDEYHFLCVRVSTILIKEVTIGNDGRKSLPLLSLYVSGTLNFTQPFTLTSEPLRIIFHLSFFRHAQE